MRRQKHETPRWHQRIRDNENRTREKSLIRLTTKSLQHSKRCKRWRNSVCVPQFNYLEWTLVILTKWIHLSYRWDNKCTYPHWKPDLSIIPCLQMIFCPTDWSECSIVMFKRMINKPSWNNLLAKYWPIHGTLKFLSATFRLGIFKVANIGPFLFSRILPIILSGYGKIYFANIGPVLFSRILPII